jgi:anti-sigma regulatory factor (Ser/Thr protein kinase)
MGRRVATEFDGTPEAVGAARRFVVAALAAWDLDDLSEVAQICTSEAATNAIRHAGTAFRLSIQSDDGEALVRIEDYGPGQPQLVGPGMDAEGGRGMWLISQLASRWGWEPVAAGKAVWFAVSPGPRDSDLSLG